MKKISFIIACFSFLGAFYGECQAVEHFVRAGAGGADNGTDWTNAWTALPSVLARGDTYYVADGTYGGYTFDDPIDEELYVTIKKATEDEHGIETGWDPSYGNGAAIFTGSINVQSGYLTFDGAVGGGPGNWTSGYGFEFTSPAGTEIEYFVISSGVSNLSIRHTYFHQVGDTTAYNVGGSGIYNSGILNNALFEYCYFDNLGRLPFFLRNGSGNIFQYNYTGDICGTSVYNVNNHCEAIVIHDMDDVHFRWNYISECPSSGGFVKNNTPTADLIRIYGNYFQNGWAVLCNSGPCTNWRILNNTFHDTYGPVSGDGSVSGAYFYNNIVYKGSGVRPWSDHDYNWWSSSSIQCTMSPNIHENIIDAPGCDTFSESSDPFINSSGNNPEDFRLKAPIATWSGHSSCMLDSCNGENKYNIDLFGNVRGANGVWDIGAYEYQSGGDTTVPTLPSGLSVQ